MKRLIQLCVIVVEYELSPALDVRVCVCVCARARVRVRCSHVPWHCYRSRAPTLLAIVCVRACVCVRVFACVLLQIKGVCLCVLACVLLPIF